MAQSYVLSGARYFTGKPCKHGHVAERLVSSRGCVVCRRLGVKRYVKAHPEKRKRLMLGATRRYLQRHPERRRESTTAYRAAHKDQISAYAKEYVDRDRAAWNARTAEYKKSHPARRAEWERRRKAQILRACPEWVNSSDLLRFYEEAQRLTKETGVRYSVDHIVPLQNLNVCGLHVPDNLQVMPLLDNIRKGARFGLGR